jgi:hypothetical protein
VIPPDEIAGYVRKYHKIYCGLAMPGTDDLTLNPEKLRNTGRKECCRKIEGLIILVTHPSRFQTKKT